MDLRTTYMGMELKHPIVASASPLSGTVANIKRLEDAGASAIVMHSLFEEQITAERLATLHHLEAHGEAHAEAASYFPRMDEFALGPDAYLEQIRRIKQCVHLPVIASLNGTTGRGWTEYARLMAQAGADAIEVNVYAVATEPDVTGEAIEGHVVDAATRVRAAVTIPVAVKLSPFFSSVAHLAHRLDAVGVNGLVLFNRFYQPDIDIDALEVAPRLRLSDSSELLLRVRWLAILAGRLRASLAASGGVHDVTDVVKAVMAGADAVQLVSVLLQHGPERLGVLLRHLEDWMVEHEYESLRQMKGSMSLGRCPNPAAFERGNYVKLLQTWRTI